ncbi:MAG: bifunctional diaminohydroxyphosphoribosylaminopyrimidine deaminase/5-amino-6-(5-phosphoribosylamino)uracil reductase RibD [Hyphomicrobiaceae bacterium]|nr:bifunctional diaminohydroxyphosphoribosylaminopyrimidine deaminase/5-amino-6-(5-phosphoribosylamino)uracil reductase RibD [Hyphomicrobiaceae bacterium]
MEFPRQPLQGPEADVRYMRIALALARRMLGATAPNPAVGAIIVDEATGEVVARGWTEAGGRPHAETQAIKRAGERARGKTMYVTLEPCSHHGKTPPCADAVVAAGLARVVCAIDDPDARVSGRGIALLHAAGIELTLSVCASEARWVAAGHITRVQAKRPLVTLKLAVSADEMIARGTGSPTWVTQADARARAHLLRAQSDAILVGRQTVVDDDPELTCRLPGLEARSPRRFVLDSNLALPAGRRLLQPGPGGPAVVFAARDAALPPHLGEDQVRRVGRGPDGRLSLRQVLRVMADDGITRLLVEGGPATARAFLDAGFVDEVVVFKGARPLGPDGILPLVDRGLGELAEASLWRMTDSRCIGADSVAIYRSRRHD